MSAFEEHVKEVVMGRAKYIDNKLREFITPYLDESEKELLTKITRDTEEGRADLEDKRRFKEVLIKHSFDIIIFPAERTDSGWRLLQTALFKNGEKIWSSQEEERR